MSEKHYVRITLDIDRYETFLADLLNNEPSFQDRLRADPLAVLNSYGIELPQVNPTRLKKLIGEIGLPPHDKVNDFVSGIEQLAAKEEDALGESDDLLQRLAVDDAFRRRLVEDPQKTLSDAGIDPDLLDLPEKVSLPPKEEIASLLQKGRRTMMFSAAMQAHYSLEWYLLTTGGRAY